MTHYTAPVRDMRFAIEALADLDTIAAMPAFAEAEVNGDLVEAVLEEAGKLARDVLSPLNVSGDRQGARLDDGQVSTPEGFPAAYRQYVDGGWNGLGAPAAFGGQGLPELLNTAVHEMLNASNMSFALCPMLTAGAIEALKHHGSDAQQSLYLPKLVSGQWTGTMNLTEPQAGSDLSAVRTRAVPEDDHYRLKGQKIFITWGEHDCAENIIHLVLARTPDAPEGVKGISLFIVPKYIPDAEGNPGARNDVRCVSIEHKLGIHGSPTCVMSFGDDDGAIGYLVGEENKGLSYMFTMMNEARLKVGLQGVAIADMAYQRARQYAHDRVQGRPLGVKHGDRVAIVEHADVRRMLLTMRCQIEAMRAVAMVTAGYMDLAKHHPDEAERGLNQARLDLLIPVVKGWCTELGVELASLGVQVHGGMGFIEETGAAQHLRDARIAPIYEGTNGIQAADLVGRKLAQDSGRTMTDLIEAMHATLGKLEHHPNTALRSIGGRLSEAVDAQTRATQSVVGMLGEDPNAAMAASFNYMMLTGYVFGGWHLARAALIACQRLDDEGEDDFHRAKIATARFYAEQILPRATGLATTIAHGDSGLMAWPADAI